MPAVIAAARRVEALDHETDRILTATETAQLLGVSERTIARMDGLPKVRLSPGRIGYSLAGVREWMVNRTFVQRGAARIVTKAA